MATLPPQQFARLRPFRPKPFGRYVLLSQVAMGGMGEVYLARQDGPNGFQKLCVIKKIRAKFAEDPSFLQRFVGEARTLATLSHGAIAQVLDMGIHEGEPFLALEHVDGKDLRKVMSREWDRGSTVPLIIALIVISRVLDALGYAHRKRDDHDRELGLVHRDVSPQNILVSYEGEVKVIDFGLAKSSLHASDTKPRVILGKFLYMAPEQGRQQRVDKRSDLYAAGICLYELITGTNPFDGLGNEDLMTTVLNPPESTFDGIRSACPKEVADTVLRALRSEPDERFQTAAEMRAALLTSLMELDPTAGPQTVSEYMRRTFASELVADRKVMQAAADAPKLSLVDGSGEEARKYDTAIMDVDASGHAAITPPAVGSRLDSAALSFTPTARGASSKSLPAADDDDAYTNPDLHAPSAEFQAEAMRVFETQTLPSDPVEYQKLDLPWPSVASASDSSSTTGPSSAATASMSTTGEATLIAPHPTDVVYSPSSYPLPRPATSETLLTVGPQHRSGQRSPWVLVSAGVLALGWIGALWTGRLVWNGGEGKASQALPTVTAVADVAVETGAILDGGLSTKRLRSPASMRAYWGRLSSDVDALKSKDGCGSKGMKEICLLHELLQMQMENAKTDEEVKELWPQVRTLTTKTADRKRKLQP